MMDMDRKAVQALLSGDTDMSKTEETRRVIEAMVHGLNEHRIDDHRRVLCRQGGDR